MSDRETYQTEPQMPQQSDPGNDTDGPFAAPDAQDGVDGSKNDDEAKKQIRAPRKPKPVSEAKCKALEELRNALTLASMASRQMEMTKEQMTVKEMTNLMHDANVPKLNEATLVDYKGFGFYHKSGKKIRYYSLTSKKAYQSDGPGKLKKKFGKGVALAKGPKKQRDKPAKDLKGKVHQVGGETDHVAGTSYDETVVTYQQYHAADSGDKGEGNEHVYQQHHSVEGGEQNEHMYQHHGEHVLYQQQQQQQPILYQQQHVVYGHPQYGGQAAHSGY